MNDEFPLAPNKAHQAVLARINAFCRLGLRRVEVDDISVALADSFGNLDLIHATDRRAEQLSGLEFALGQGPALDCFSSQRPVAASDLSGKDAVARWPVFAPEAVRVGAASVQVLPLSNTGRSLGTVTMYRASPVGLSVRQYQQAQSVTEMINLALVSPEAQAGVGTTFRMSVHQAAGMLMEQTGMDIHDALVLLRATAYSEDKPVEELADEVVKGGRRFRGIEARDE